MPGKPDFNSLSMAHISLAFIGLMWTLPFLYFHHAYPINTFYQEWGAALLGLCAMPVLITKRFWIQAEIPRIVLLPASMMLLVLAQFSMGRIANFDQTLLLTLYLLWAVLLIMLSKHLRNELGLPLMATTLAVFLLVGTELNALFGIAQHYHWHIFLDTVVSAKTSLAVYGNVAQPNHFASYVTVGLVSLGLLFARKALPTWQGILLAIPLLFVLVLSGSRSSWLYLLWILLMAFLWQRRDKSMLPLLRYCGLLVLGFGLMHLAVEIPWLAGSDAGVTTIERMFGGDAGNSSIRWALLHEAWLIFRQFPLFGAGFGQFAWQHLQLDVALHESSINGLYNNAHNIVAQIAAEAGLVGVLILLSMTALWLWQIRGAQRSIDHFWGYAILSVLSIHSLLEYPLFYAYFLGLAAILLGMLDNTVYRLKLYNLGRLLVAMMLILGGLSLTQLFQSYSKLEDTLALRSLATKDSKYVLQMRNALIEIHGHLLLSSYAESFISGMSEASSDHLTDKLALNERAMRFMPIASVVYRQAWLLALAGQQKEAVAQLERAIWAYPNDFLSAQAELKALAQNDPIHFAALLEFAIQKNAE